MNQKAVPVEIPRCTCILRKITRDHTFNFKIQRINKKAYINKNEDNVMN